MFKKIVFATLTILSVFGVGFLLYNSNKSHKKVLCRGVIINIDKPKGAIQFMTKEDILSELSRKGFKIKGLDLDSINTAEIEHTLNQNPLFDESQVLSSKATGNIIINLKQKFPKYIVQIKDTLYYVGENKKFIPVNFRYMANVPIVTGELDSTMATEHSFSLIESLKGDSLLSKLVGQIYYDKEKGFILSHKMSSAPIIIGSDTTQWKDAFHKIHIFLDKIEPKIGWGRINYLNMSYKDQIVVGDKFFNKEKNKEQDIYDYD